MGSTRSQSPMYRQKVNKDKEIKITYLLLTLIVEHLLIIFATFLGFTCIITQKLHKIEGKYS